MIQKRTYLLMSLFDLDTESCKQRQSNYTTFFIHHIHTKLLIKHMSIDMNSFLFYFISIFLRLHIYPFSNEKKNIQEDENILA